MSLDGLTAKQTPEGRVVVEYLDVARVDLSSVMERLFDKAFGPSFERLPNVIPIDKNKETPNGTT